MTKGDLIKFLEPFRDEIQIEAKIDNLKIGRIDDISYEIDEYGKVVLKIFILKHNKKGITNGAKASFS